jgi:hypothetical protein
LSTPSWEASQGWTGARDAPEDSRPADAGVARARAARAAVATVATTVRVLFTVRMGFGSLRLTSVTDQQR